MKKTNRIIGIFIVVMLTFSIAGISVFGSSNSSSQDNVNWQGDVNFWESQVGNTTKNNDENTSYTSFLNASGNRFYLYLTIRDNSGSNTVVTNKTKISLGSGITSTTKAVNGGVYKITAAREYIADTKTNCSGQWRP